MLWNHRMQLTITNDHILIDIRPVMNFVDIICITIIYIMAIFMNRGLKLSIMLDCIHINLLTGMITAERTANINRLILLIICMTIICIVAKLRNHGIEYSVQHDHILIDIIPREEIPEI